MTDERIDARLVPPVIGLWVGTLGGLIVEPRPLTAVAVCLSGSYLLVRRIADDRRRRAVMVVLVCVLAGSALGALRAAPVRDGPVARLAAAEAFVHVEGAVATDPQSRGGVASTEGEPGAPYVVARLRIDEITGRGRTHHLRTRVVILARDQRWAELLPGQRVHAAGRLAPSDGVEVAAVLSIDGPPTTSGGPGYSAVVTEPLRAGLRRAVADLDPRAAGLVPALVVGDESLLLDDVRADMQAAGLAHLTAVSGTNLTILVVVVLGVARWTGVRGYALPVLAALCVVGFVLLARPEPSVIRAAVMGSVGVMGSSVAGRRRGVPALATAAGILLLVDPWLARNVGFGLSVCATAGILVLAPRWQIAMWWLPRPVALAVVIPLAAQVACTPLVLTTFDEVSVAALPANILAAPAVAPATVLGLVAAVVAPASDSAALVVARLAGLPAAWIVRVAGWGAGLPGAVVAWPAGTVGAVLALAWALVAIVVLPIILRRPFTSVLAVAVLVLGVTRAVPSPGWPPPRWIAVACDVGQGDALALRVAEHTAVVVDAGPDPRLVARCLDSLGVSQVPLLVLTHFHADHVMGVPGVLAGRDVGRVLVSPLRDPEPNATQVAGWLADAGVPAEVAAVGSVYRVGPALAFKVVWPRRLVVSDESAANNASIVLAARLDGVDLLLTGDVEPTAQAALRRAEPDLAADVLKVAHHGSSHQDFALIGELGADVALVSVGENDYGHPSPRVVRELRDAGAQVYRTDQSGHVAVVLLPDGRLGVVTSRRG
ncbi:MAG: ComEC/Rec2 family competence protein [Jiangellaceae bacterium]